MEIWRMDRRCRLRRPKYGSFGCGSDDARFDCFDNAKECKDEGSSEGRALRRCRWEICRSRRPAFGRHWHRVGAEQRVQEVDLAKGKKQAI